MPFRSWNHDPYSKLKAPFHLDEGSDAIQWAVLPYCIPETQVGGHEGVGKVVKLGAGTENSGLKIGDRVGIKWVASACGNCRKSLYQTHYPKTL